VAEYLEDRSEWLSRLAEEAAPPMPIAIAREDSLLAPSDSRSGLRRAEAASAAQAGSRPLGAGTPATPSLRQPRSSHPRNARIIPKSRDFH